MCSLAILLSKFPSRLNFSDARFELALHGYLGRLFPLGVARTVTMHDQNGFYSHTNLYFESQITDVAIHGRDRTTTSNLSLCNYR